MEHAIDHPGSSFSFNAITLNDGSQGDKMTPPAGKLSAKCRHKRLDCANQDACANCLLHHVAGADFIAGRS